MDRNVRTTAILWTIATLVATSAAADELIIATLNCEFLTRPRVHMKFDKPFDLRGRDVQTWDEPGYRDARFAEAAKAVAELIQRLDADIIGLTEVGDARDVKELHDAVAELGLNYAHVEIGKSIEPNTHQNVALFSRFPTGDLVSPIPGHEAYDIELDDPGSEQWASVDKSLRCTVTYEGRKLHVYVLHMKSERGGYESDARRIAQASIVRRHYLPLLQSGADVIVMGDLNDKINDPAIRRIRGRDDVGPDLVQTGHAIYFDRGQYDSRWTYNYQGERNQIDHVLLSTSLVTLDAAKPNIRAFTMDPQNKLVSDHRPFGVEIRLGR